MTDTNPTKVMKFGELMRLWGIISRMNTERDWETGIGDCGTWVIERKAESELTGDLYEDGGEQVAECSTEDEAKYIAALDPKTMMELWSYTFTLHKKVEQYEKIYKALGLAIAEAQKP